jgi:glycosyltransferase involved in cell wall biosynthesis
MIFENSMKSSRVLVLMTTFNDITKHLRASINSILNQTYSYFDLLIIDDGSDNKEEIIDLVNTLGDDRIILHHNERNIGLALSLNKAIIEFSKIYDFIVRMDADDISSKRRLEYLIRHMEYNHNIDICSSYGVMFGHVFKPIFYYLNNEEIRIDLLFRSPILHAGCIIRTKSLQTYRIIYNNVPAEDYDLWFRLSKIDVFKFSNISRFLYYYRIRIKENSDKVYNQIKIMTEIHKYYLPNIPEVKRAMFIELINKTYTTNDEIKLVIDVLSSLRNNFLIKGFNLEVVNRTLHTKLVVYLIKSNLFGNPKDIFGQYRLLNHFSRTNKYRMFYIHKNVLSMIYHISLMFRLILSIIRRKHK